jgi:endonuclease G
MRRRNNKKTRFQQIIASTKGLAVLFCLTITTLSFTNCEETPKEVISSAKEIIETIDSKAEVSEKRPSGKARQLELPGKLKGVKEQIITHTGFTLSFNKEHNTPNWVAWELTAEETEGEKPRAESFLPDPNVSPQHQVTTEDYVRSGYDRGHMVPAADMKWSMKAMNDCFYMTNICPQDGGLNSGSWQTLEKACRRWAKQEGKVYVVCGPVYKSTKPKKLGKEHKISVPDGFYKVVLSMREGKEKAIGFYYENRSGKQEMKYTATSVDEIEALTGINFFVNVPDKLEDKIEATYSLKLWR